MRLEPFQFVEDLFCLKIGKFIIHDDNIDPFMQGKEQCLLPTHRHQDAMPLVLQNLTIK